MMAVDQVNLRDYKDNLRKTAAQAEGEGFRVFGNMRQSVNMATGMVYTGIASTRGKRRWRPESASTPCLNCKHLCYSITSVVPRKGEWPCDPSCIAKRDPEEDVPAALDVYGFSTRKCPDFEERDASA